MAEETQETQETKTAEKPQGKEEAAPEKETASPKQEEVNPVEQARKVLGNLKEENKRFEKNIAELKKVTAENMLSGRGKAVSPKVLDKRTDKEKETEYAEKLQRGEVNPLKEDGFL